MKNMNPETNQAVSTLSADYAACITSLFNAGKMFVVECTDESSLRHPEGFRTLAFAEARREELDSLELDDGDGGTFTMDHEIVLISQDEDGCLYVGYYS
jgi:hypothetical protein